MTTLTPTHIEVVSFPVEGMTCASCVNRITRFLNKVEGVAEANVNLASESATIRFDPASVTVADLVAAVDAAGYVARVEQAASADHEVDVTEAADARTERDEAAARHVTALRRRRPARKVSRSRTKVTSTPSAARAASDGPGCRLRERHSIVVAQVR